MRDIQHRAAFESQNEAYDRLLAEKDDDIGRNARAWLAEQQSLLDEEAALKRDAREERTLEIANDANSLALEANSIARIEAAAASRSARYAMYAAIIAAIGAIAANKENIFSTIELLLN